MLAGVYAGLVLLATQVFRVHTPVAVAAATLAAAGRRACHRAASDLVSGEIWIRERLPVW